MESTICRYTFDECPTHFYCVLTDGHEGEHGGYEDGPCPDCPPVLCDLPTLDGPCGARDGHVGVHMGGR